MLHTRVCEESHVRKEWSLPGFAGVWTEIFADIGTSWESETLDSQDGNFCARVPPVCHQNGELAQFSAGAMALPYREFLPAPGPHTATRWLNQPNQCRGASNIRALDSEAGWPSQKRSINACSFFPFLRFIFSKKKIIHHESIFTLSLLAVEYLIQNYLLIQNETPLQQGSNVESQVLAKGEKA